MKGGLKIQHSDFQILLEEVHTPNALAMLAVR